MNIFFRFSGRLHDHNRPAELLQKCQQPDRATQTHPEQSPAQPDADGKQERPPALPQGQLLEPEAHPPQPDTDDLGDRRRYDTYPGRDDHHRVVPEHPHQGQPVLGGDDCELIV